MSPLLPWAGAHRCGIPPSLPAAWTRPVVIFQAFVDFIGTSSPSGRQLYLAPQSPAELVFYKHLPLLPPHLYGYLIVLLHGPTRSFYTSGLAVSEVIIHVYRSRVDLKVLSCCKIIITMSLSISIRGDVKMHNSWLQPNGLFIIISRKVFRIIVNVLFSVVMATCIPVLFSASKV